MVCNLLSLPIHRVISVPCARTAINQIVWLPPPRGKRTFDQARCVRGRSNATMVAVISEAIGLAQEVGIGLPR